jgi:large subunit ribosomal protein L24
MSIAKIQSGDTVKVTSGNYKGTVGQVLKIFPKIRKNGRVIKRASLTNIPKIVKYRKSNVFQGQQYPGLKLETDRTIDLSNLSLLTDDNTISKSKIELLNGKKVRVLKKNNQTVSNVKIIKVEKTVSE